MVWRLLEPSILTRVPVGTVGRVGELAVVESLAETDLTDRNPVRGLGTRVRAIHRAKVKEDFLGLIIVILAQKYFPKILAKIIKQIPNC